MDNQKFITKNEIKKYGIKLLILLGIMLGSVVAGVLLLSLVFYVPFPLEKREEILGTLKSEGWYPRATIQTAVYGDNFGEFYPDILDYGTDEVILLYSTGNCEVSPIDQSIRVPFTPGEEYFRYWHGYALFLRPLLLIFDLSQIRIINTWIQIGIVFLLSCLLY